MNHLKDFNERYDSNSPNLLDKIFLKLGIDAMDREDGEVVIQAKTKFARVMCMLATKEGIFTKAKDGRSFRLKK